MNLFPDIDRETIAIRVDLAWDLNGPLPVPKFTPVCSCGQKQWHARLWRFHLRSATEPGRFSHRATISLKCVSCSLVATYGLVLTESAFYRFTRGRRERTVHWREAERMFDES